MVDCKKCIFPLLKGCPTGGSHNAACITLYKDRSTCKKEDCEKCRNLKYCREAGINLNNENKVIKRKPICPICQTDEFIKRKEYGSCSHIEIPNGHIHSESWECEKCYGDIHTYLEVQNDEIQEMSIKYTKINGENKNSCNTYA